MNDAVNVEKRALAPHQGDRTVMLDEAFDLILRLPPEQLLEVMESMN